jgi:hypothetical protein
VSAILNDFSVMSRSSWRQKQVAALPDLPIAAEADLSGYGAATWWGLFAPMNTPRKSSSGWPRRAPWR